MKLTTGEIQFLIALLEANAHFHKRRYETEQQVNAELLARKLEEMMHE